MTRKELQQLRKAVRSVTRPEHMLYFEGNNFSCRWANGCFEWKAPSGTMYNLDARETLKYIGDGEGILYFSYDYNDNENTEEV
jgi:hypothetical protein